MVPPNETGSISEPVFFALRYNYLFRPYSTILSGRLHNRLIYPLRHFYNHYNK